jgi:hypothetical protein
VLRAGIRVQGKGIEKSNIVFTVSGNTLFLVPMLLKSTYFSKRGKITRTSLYTNVQDIFVMVGGLRMKYWIFVSYCYGVGEGKVYSSFKNDSGKRFGLCVETC